MSYVRRMLRVVHWRSRARQHAFDQKGARACGRTRRAGAAEVCVRIPQIDHSFIVALKNRGTSPISLSS